MMKRFASHYLFVAEVGFFKQQVVELEDGFASHIFPLTEEIESVEWLPGVIILCPQSDVISTMQLLTKGLSSPFGAERQPDAKSWHTLLASTQRVAYLLYPFDFSLMQPVDETQHRLLR